MSLRRKMLLILLLTAVVPMIAVRTVHDYSVYRLKDRVGSDMRERLNAQAKQDMQRTVEGYADSLDKVNRLGFALLRIQANDIERRLTGPRPPHSPLDVPTVQQFARFDEVKRDQWGVVNSERYMVADDSGVPRPLAISYQTQVVLPPSDGRLSQQNQADVARLAGMSNTYRRLHDEAGDVILWQYTALSSGLHFSYPGKADFPENYSPLDQDWYRLAVAARGPTYIPPYVDSSTRQLVVTFSQPLNFLGGGGLAGVTAIDLSVSRLLNPDALNTTWAEQAEVKVVAAYPALRLTEQETEDAQLPAGERPRRIGRQSQPDQNTTDRNRDNPPRRAETISAIGEGLSARNSKPDLSYPRDVYIVAQNHQKTETDQQHTAVVPVAFDSKEVRDAISQDLVDGKTGVRRVMIAGQDMIVAYGRIGGDTGRPLFTFISAPASTIFAPAEKAVAEVDQQLEASLVTSGGIVLGLLVLVGMVAFGLSDRLSRPIIEMAIASRRVAKGDLEARVNIDRNDEIGELGIAFNEMVPALNDRVRIRESLAVAMQVQQSLLPSGPPSIPGLDIAGHSEYCDETGGDYYDFIELDQAGPRSLAIAVGDVTGHGIAAALLMATGRALIRSHANQHGSLGEVFSAVNNQLCDSEFTGRFMTLMYLIVDGQCDDDGRVCVRYLSAGHDPIVVYRPDEDRFIELAGNDIPLGIEPGWSFHEHRSEELRRGDILFAGTDGIWECFNPEGEQFGKDRMREIIREAANGSAEEISQAVSQACRAWRGERDQNDDITQVVVKLVG